MYYFVSNYSTGKHFARLGLKMELMVTQLNQSSLKQQKNHREIAVTKQINEA